MKRLPCLLLLCAVTAAASGRADDPLVDASKEAKTKRKKSTTKVITNADVRKSKGTLIDTTAPADPLPPAGPGMVEQHEAAMQARAALAAKTALLEKQIALLEKDLAAVEQSYYDESDLRRRDTEIVRRFTETKQRLDEARAQLAVAKGETPGAAPESKPESKPGAERHREP
jgi:hypothetical protein